MHRAENVDSRETLSGLVTGLLMLDKKIVFPAHPRTVARLEESGLLDKIEESGNMKIIDPVGYLDFLRLIYDSEYVITDSGGIQEEVTAPSINKRVFVIRSSTERPEAVESGHSIVVGVDPTSFPDSIRDAMKMNDKTSRVCPYGDGKASQRIIDFLQAKND
jgi:UDP-N-acetylglucosamine 2-epimerase (non-hydrolysing)